jgi:hypothetical protein
MDDPLAIYLHDDLASASLAIDLLEAMQKQYHGESLGDFATEVLGEVTADYKVLKELAGKVGKASDVLKDATAWMSERASRLRLRKGASGGTGQFRSARISNTWYPGETRSLVSSKHGCGYRLQDQNR